jgi:23S rRNA (adenine-N6)-dimethyltransferase
MGQAQRTGSRGAVAGRTDRDRRRRELSQNYLRSPEAARQFLRAVRLDPDGLCVEVGAGEGILTTRLAAMCREVVAYEVDAALADRLQDRLQGRDNVRLVLKDFLAARPPSRPFQVVGNAPFSLTSPIIDWCLRASRMRTATLITQLEYARKRTGGYGRWSLLTCTTWPQLSWELRGRLPRTLFRPVPRVDAGILHLERRAKPLVSPARQHAYRQLVQAGFSGVGGSVQASLRRSYPADKVAQACADAGVDRRAVVAFVSPDQWVQIFTALDSRS